MKGIGSGVCEIRIRDEDGAYRVIYVASMESAIYILHCFKKTSQKNERSRSRYGDAELPYAQIGEELMKTENFRSVWDAIEDTPAEAENMRLRSGLMIQIQQHIESHGLTQAKAAKLFGVTQPRMSDLKRGKIDLFSLDTLVNMVAAAGLHIELRISDAA